MVETMSKNAKPKFKFCQELIYIVLCNPYSTQDTQSQIAYIVKHNNLCNNSSYYLIDCLYQAAINNTDNKFNQKLNIVDVYHKYVLEFVDNKLPTRLDWHAWRLL